MLFENSWYHHFVFCGIPWYIIHKTICLGQLKKDISYLDCVVENYSPDVFTYELTLTFCLWAFIWLKASAKHEKGAENTTEKHPSYKINGFLYYLSTLSVFFVLQSIYPDTSTIIYTKFHKILESVFNFLAHVIAFWWVIIYKMPYPNFFFYGMESLPHPRYLGIDVKQLFTVRLGLMSSQIFLCAFYIVAYNKYGFNVPTLVNFIIQSAYIARIFWQEIRFYSTLNTMVDGVGFYLCWGGAVIFPAAFTFPAVNTIIKPPTVSESMSLAFGFFCLVCIILSCKADQEKHAFESSSDGKCKIWGKPARYILAECKTSSGEVETVKLLTSGFKGIVRHINFTFELIIYMTFYATLGLLYDSWCAINILFLCILIILHVNRQEKKLKNKYGEFWEKYCEKVPYKLIPGIW